MNICSYKHDEVCYEDKHCPMCTLIQEHADEIEKLKEEHDNYINSLPVED